MAFVSTWCSALFLPNSVLFLFNISKHFSQLFSGWEMLLQKSRLFPIVETLPESNLVIGITNIMSLYFPSVNWTMKARTVLEGIPSFVKATNWPLKYSIHWAMYTSPTISTIFLSVRDKLQNLCFIKATLSFPVSTLMPEICWHHWQMAKWATHVPVTCSTEQC